MRSIRRANTLDCAKGEVWVFWFAVGAVFAAVIMAGYADGHSSSLLRVGSENPLLHRIEADLGAISSSDPIGHDGQLYYLIARDPLGVRGTPEAIAVFDNNGPRYRYRRILFPLLGGGFGQLPGRAALFGMIVLLAVAMGIATVAIADIGFQLNLRGGTVLAAAMNVGALVSLLLLTADALALALALAGIAMVLRSRMLSALVLLALATLTKEVYVLVAMSVAAWLWHQRLRGQAVLMASAPAAPTLLWSLWLFVTMPPGSGTVRNVGLPFVGVVQAIPIWIRGERNLVELFLIGFVALTLGAAALALILGSSRVLRWSVAPWCGLACAASVAVWGKPNNAARAFAILWPLAVLLLSERWNAAIHTTGRAKHRRRGNAAAVGLR